MSFEPYAAIRRRRSTFEADAYEVVFVASPPFFGEVEIRDTVGRRWVALEDLIGIDDLPCWFERKLSRSGSSV